MKPFNHALSLAIDAAHTRIEYIKRMLPSPAARRRLKTLRADLRKLERKIS
jgi:hypothetical protein